tara:strand:- start:76 stop:231 length:156 start_codon:yes stop_codon:yes gene_type:complete
MMFVGMQDRLFKEVAALAPSAVKIRVIDPPERLIFIYYKKTKCLDWRIYFI